MKKSKSLTSTFTHTMKTASIVSILIVGALIVSIFIAFIQVGSSKERQKINSEKALQEVSLTISNNDQTIKQVKYEYNKLNQNTVQVLGEYTTSSDLFQDYRNANGAKKEEYANKFCSELVGLRAEIESGTISVCDQNGKIYLSSEDIYIGKNLAEFIDAEFFINALNFDSDRSINGTEQKNEDGETIYTPIVIENFYVYSSYLYSEGGEDYFVLLSVSTGFLNDELHGLNQIGDVLKSLSVGTSGFFFAIDTESNTFAYFDHNGTSLTDLTYQEHGYQQSAAIDGYDGYQKIDGVSYYCVTKQASSDTYGNYIIVAAAVNRSELILQNLLTTFVSGIAFVIVACIVAGYGMILDRDLAKYYIDQERKTKDKIKDKKIEGVGRFTEQEVKERADFYMEQMIESGEDKKLKRINIGFRTRKGKQNYFSPYIGMKLTPIFVIGIVSIFVIVFFSQTIMAVQDATSVATSKLTEISKLVEEDNENGDNISAFVTSQYLSKAKLIGYDISNNPSDVLKSRNDSEKTFQLYKEDEEGTKTYLKDEFGNARYSNCYNDRLQGLCTSNGIGIINIFDQDGYCIATSDSDWFYTLSFDKNNSSYEFRGIIDGKYNDFIQKYEIDEKGNKNQYIGTVFYYYTCDENGFTQYVTESEYESFLANEWTSGEVIKHRGMIQVSIDHTNLQNIYKLTSLDYVLSGTSVYGEGSFFIAFDDSEEHKIVYAPDWDLIDKEAATYNIPENAFSITEHYNGFHTINEVNYYQSYQYVDGFYIATCIPGSELYFNRLKLSLITLAVGALFILVGAGVSAVSNDVMDRKYRMKIMGSEKGNGRSVGFTITDQRGKKRKTVSAYSRYINVSWKRRTVEQKLGNILTIYFTIISFIFLIIMIYALSASVKLSIFTYIFSGNWEKGINLFSITKAIMIIVMILTVSKIAKFLVKTFASSLGARAETTGNLIVSVIKYGGVIGSFFYALYLFGFNTGSLLTSAGILSVVVGLGAQSLIGDIIAGMFIVFEGEFRVGDIVKVEDFRGQVLEIGIRTTKLVDIANNIKIFNNSTISSVINMTKEYSIAMIDVGIEYGEDLNKVEQVLMEGLPNIRANLPSVIEGPDYRGVQELGDSAVVIRITAGCEEKDRIQLERDLNREIFLLFKEHDINIPFNQVTLSYLEEGGKKNERSSDHN